MRKDIKKRWVEALRSGKYKQTKGELCDNVDGEKKFCCLGVLCDIRRDVKWENEIACIDKDKDCLVVPLPLRKKIKLKDEDQAILIEMNDTGKSFKYIANWIEMHL